MNNYSKSKALYERACQTLAGGVSSEFRKFNQPHPLFYERGTGSRIIDVDGNEYLDFSLSQGPLLLGHSPEYVLKKVAEASCTGQLFAGQYLLELELAEKLKKIIPCAELIRFSLSGSEADHAALRVARAVTGRSKFIRFEGHYHGWFDNVALGISGPSLEALGDYNHPIPIEWTRGLPPGIADQCILLPWNDLEIVEQTLKAHAREVAAIITEPVMCNSGCIPPIPGYLEGLRHLCDQYGIALIFDEIITGFRLSLSGAQGYYQVIPDLATFGKALANGFPISVLAGKHEWMQVVADGSVIQAGTMNSGQPSIAAAVATIEILEKEGTYERLFCLGNQLMAGLRTAAVENNQAMLIQGPGPMFHTGFTQLPQASNYRDLFAYDKNKLSKFVFGLQESGIRIIGRGLWYISAAHTEQDVETAIGIARQVLKELS